MLATTFPGRFLLGLGCSHQPLVEHVYGQRYERPLDRMSRYLDDMDRSASRLGPSFLRHETGRVLAALGPKMLHLAAESADGAFPYLQTPGHTAMARQIIGNDALLAVEQMAILEGSPSAARELARQHLSHYLPLRNYRANFARLGFDEDDLVDGGSNRLVDSLFAWGTADSVAGRLREQQDAGADHVAVQVIRPSVAEPANVQWAELSAALL